MLASCASPQQAEPPAIAQCREYLLKKLKAPSTYKQIQADQVKMDDGKWSVVIQYDAANAYGTPIRDNQVCRYPDLNDQPDTRKYIDFDEDLVADAMKAAS
ncbi:hypothetical protein ASE59_11585 [Sphingomonas sp. Leaf10]|nr:hypothetical protein ASE59_11585 [Sphingomonas sp. Leaf10]